MTHWRRWFAWTVFVTTNLVTIYVHSRLWYLANQQSILDLLFCASVVLGIWAFFETKGKIAVISFLLILVVGQLWMIETAATLLIWSINGFAP